MQFRRPGEYSASPRTSSIIARSRAILMGDTLSRQRPQPSAPASSTSGTRTSANVTASTVRPSPSRSYSFGTGSSRRETRLTGRAVPSRQQSGVGNRSPERPSESPVAPRTRFGATNRVLATASMVRSTKFRESRSRLSDSSDYCAGKDSGRRALVMAASRGETIVKELPFSSGTKPPGNDESSGPKEGDWSSVPSNSILASMAKRSAGQHDEQAYEPQDLFEKLKRESLVETFGVLHAVGLRHVEDLAYFTKEDFKEMQIKEVHAEKLVVLSHQEPVARRTRTSVAVKKTRFTIGSQSFFPKQFQKANFQVEAISVKHKIFKGRFLSIEQCNQIVRMSEVFAYQHTGWRPEIYTLTNLDLHVKAIPEMLSILDPLFKQSMDEMPQLYEDCKPGSVKYRNDNEPHLVKYTGDVHKGVCMHTDSAEITLNIALSDPDDFEGGGTYFECLDETVMLKKGEMLIHPGNLKHQGMDVSSGVRHILVAFMSCQWKAKHSVYSSCLRGS